MADADMAINAALKFPVLTASGTVPVPPAFLGWTGGRGVFAAWGTFGGGTLTLQWSPDLGVTWMNVDRSGDTFVTLTAAGQGGFELGPCRLQVVLTGATAPNIVSGVEFAFR